MKKYFKVLVCLLLTIASFSQDATNQEIHHYLHRYHNTRQLSGVVSITNKTGVHDRYVLGWKNVKAGVPLSGDEVFGIGSTTKLFTALLVMREVEKGNLHLQSPLTTWLPDTKIPCAKDITIKQLLQHTSGLGNYMNHPRFGELMLAGRLRTIDDLLPLLEEVPLKGSPGAAWAYSNSGYILLGKVLEKVTGIHFHQLLQQQMLQPLQLNASFTALASASASIAQPYRFVGKENYIQFAYPDTIRCFPDGGLLMTASDLSRFGQALLEKKIISSSTFQTMLQDTVRIDDRSWQGLGIMIEEIDGKRWIGHDGFSRGYSVDIKISPAEKMVLVSMFNNNGISSVSINQSIIGMMHGKAPVAPKPYLWQIIHAYQENHLTTTLAALNDMLKEKGYRPITSSMQMIGMTNDLAEAGLAAAALKILQFNRDLFPEEAVSYKALGDAYMAIKQTPEAVECFKKALKINAGDAYAVMRLKELGAL